MLLALILGLIGGVMLTINQIWLFRQALSEYGWSEPVAMVLLILAVALAPTGIVGAVLVYKKGIIAGILMLISPIVGYVMLAIVDRVMSEGMHGGYLGFALGLLFSGFFLFLGGLLSINTVLKSRKKPVSD